MTRKSWMLAGFALALAIAYVVFYTNWFKPGTIRIYHLTRPSGFAARVRRDASAPPITFGLASTFKLTEIKAVPLAGWQANPNTLPVWHLVSDSNSAPVQFFVYGQHIRGMKPAVAGGQAQPLENHTTYRLFVTAGKIRGQHDFEIGGSLSGSK